MAVEDGNEMDVIPGETEYTLQQKIASGGMGSVYEAVQSGAEGFTKTVAIKTILPRYTDNAEFTDMFIGEAKLVANLVHQNIVQIYQLGKYNRGYFISMEFIDGINLEQFFMAHQGRSVTMPIDIATFIVSRVCRGLEYAHSKRDDDGNLLGIVHRDVSPKNVMITHEGEVKLTDFGVAKARNYMEQEEGEVLMGKVEYMSPEQASYMVTDARSDIFSLGIIFYELLTGENIFETDDVFEIIERVKTMPIPDPREYRPDIPSAVANIIQTCLQRDLDKRYRTAGELGYALEYYMYSGGYGPTILTLAKYVSEFFPGHRFSDAAAKERDSKIDSRADTIYQSGK
jgi:serine/threonine-protein kinase